MAGVKRSAEPSVGHSLSNELAAQGFSKLPLRELTVTQVGRWLIADSVHLFLICSTSKLIGERISQNAECKDVTNRILWATARSFEQAPSPKRLSPRTGTIELAGWVDAIGRVRVHIHVRIHTPAQTNRVALDVASRRRFIVPIDVVVQPTLGIKVLAG
jgi:hypothetical protein